MQMLRVGSWLPVAACIGAWPHSACAQTSNYRFKVFKAPGNVSEALVARNAAGAKLFVRRTASGVSSCRLEQGGRESVISDPGGANTYCTGLGSDGGVVGWYNAGGITTPYTGFAYLNGAYADVVPGETNPIWGSTVGAVSPNGLMAGTYQAADGYYQIFLTYGSSYNYIQISGVPIVTATGVRDTGVIVAQELFPTMRGDIENSVLIVDGVMSAISFPGSVATYAEAINKKGDVVGNYYDADYLEHGFIYSSSRNAYFGPIDVPGAAGMSLIGISSDDVVTGAVSYPGAANSQAFIGFPAVGGLARR